MTGIEPKNRRLGYARVSAYGQTLDALLAQLRGTIAHASWSSSTFASFRSGASKPSVNQL